MPGFIRMIFLTGKSLPDKFTSASSVSCCHSSGWHVLCWLAFVFGVSAGQILSSPLLQAADKTRGKRVPIRDPEHRFNRKLTSWSVLKKKNVVMQQRDYSCGAAALATLMRHHWGDDITETELILETIRMLTGEEIRDRVENGLTLSDLRRLAVRKDYLSTIGRLEFDKLSQSKVPLLVGIVDNGFDHFVVYRGTDRKYVYLADPSLGNVRKPIPKFKKQWQKNAVLVVVKKGSDLQKQSKVLLQREETKLGRLNDFYLRDRLTTPVFSGGR